jgi:Protein of unknown function (DUF1360)
MLPDQRESDADTMWRFLLAVLATWRVTHLLASEDGPGDIVYRFRRWQGQSFAGKLMDCFNCMSLWVAASATLFVSPRATEWLISWLALSGGACLLERLAREPVIVQRAPNLSQGDPNYVLWPEAHAANKPSGIESDHHPELQEKHPE